MPNWTRNSLTVEGNKDELRKMIDSVQNGDNPFSLEKIVTEPDWKNTPNSDGELPTYDNPNTLDECLRWSDGKQDMRWYDWRSKLWGTKWDTCETEVTNDSDTVWQVDFLTAWSDPRPAIEALARKHPTLTFAVYAEHECGSDPSDYTFNR